MKNVPNNCGIIINNSKINKSLDELKMHAFVDKTYFNPTHCNFCGGLLVGLVLFKQGYQCKYCKYDCHKNCLKFVPRNCEANECNSNRNSKCYDDSTISSKTNNIKNDVIV